MESAPEGITAIARRFSFLLQISFKLLLICQVKSFLLTPSHPLLSSSLLPPSLPTTLLYFQHSRSLIPFVLTPLSTTSLPRPLPMPDRVSNREAGDGAEPLRPFLAGEPVAESRIVPKEDLPTYETGKVPEFLGAKGPFNPKQKAIILGIYSPKYLQMRSSVPRPRKRARSDWLNTAVEEILESPLFADLDTNFSKAYWDDVRPSDLYFFIQESLTEIQRIRSIFANQVRKEKSAEAAPKKKGKDARKKEESSGGAEHDPVKCFEALRRGSRCWAHFSSEVDDGRELFRRMNADAIHQEALHIEAGNSGAAHAKALKNLWQGANQAKWNKRARKYVDVFQFVVHLSSRPVG